MRRVITNLPRRPLMAGLKGMRLSLAGAQNKLPGLHGRRPHLYRFG
jgi:serine/threonine-protein kinase HipA